MEERVISGEASKFDEGFEQSLRPQLLGQYIGQERVKHNLGIFIEAARKRKDFAEADRIRAELDAKGIELRDGKDPVTGELVTSWEVKQ